MAEGSGESVEVDAYPRAGPAGEATRPPRVVSGVAWGIGLALLAALLHAWPWLRVGGDIWSWNTEINVIEIVLPTTATAMLAWRWWTDRTLGWLLLTVGTGCWALGQLGWTVLELIGSTASPSLNDAFFVVWPILTCIGLVQLGIDRSRRGAQLVLIAEAMLVAVGAGFVVWVLFLLPGIEETGPASIIEQVLLAYLPMSSLVVAATALLLRMGSSSPALTAACLGALSNAVADAILSSDLDQRRLLTYFGAHIGWLLGFVLMGAASRLPLAPPRSVSVRPTKARLLLVWMPAAAALLVAAYHLGPGGGELDPVSVGLTVTGAMLIVVVQVVGWREVGRMSVQLEENYRQLADTEHELRSVVDSIADTVVVIGLDARIRSVNLQAEELLKMGAPELVGRHFGSLIPQSARAQVAEVWQRVLDGAAQLDKPVFPVVTGTGRVLYVEANAALDRVQRERVVLTLRDVTDRVEAQTALQRAQERFRVAFHSAPTGMAIVRPEDGMLVEVNDRFAEVFRQRADELTGTPMGRLLHPDEQPITTEASIERRFVRSNGTVLWAASSLAVTEDTFGQPMLIVHVQDVTNQKAAAEQLSWSATHDEVTGLANRAHFLEHLQRAADSPGPTGLAVLFLDLDRFKVVNDSLGHATGDDLLRVMAARLRAAVRDGDVVARFGGDEFTVLLRDVDPALAAEVAERIRSSLALPVTLGDAELDVSASVGVVIVSPQMLQDQTMDADDLVRDADAAMYRAKDHGRNRVEHFTPETRVATLHLLHTGNELRHGIERGEIVPYYQPIIDLASGRLKGYEVVARWRHPERGLLLPAEFLGVAEDRGLIGPLGEAVMRAALAQLARWRNELPQLGPLTIGVNLSARQLGDRRLVDTIGQALAETGVPADCLWLELTETALMSDVRSATVALRELRGLGLHLAVDDFGTGYSSLTYLKRFPVEALKVDRSFVAGLGLDPDDSTIVEAVVRLGSSLGLATIAEGVETPLQLGHLRDMGCEQAQGFLFGRPRPASMLEPFAATY